MKSAILLTGLFIAAIALSGCIGEQDSALACRQFCETQPHIECVGSWKVSGAYPDCGCEFECITDECESEGDRYKDECYYQWAVQDQKLEICDNVEGRTLKCRCHSEIYRERATSQWDETVCENITCLSSYKYSCLEAVAKEKKDISVCEKIADVFSRDDCIAQVAVEKNDLSECEKVGNTARKEACFKDLAEKRGDETVCETGVRDKYLREECYSDVAIAKQDQSLCELSGGNEKYCRCAIAGKPTDNCDDLKPYTQIE